jgi:hypothetical protein
MSKLTSVRQDSAVCVSLPSSSIVKERGDLTTALQGPSVPNRNSATIGVPMGLDLAGVLPNPFGPGVSRQRLSDAPLDTNPAPPSTPHRIQNQYFWIDSA